MKNLLKIVIVTVLLLLALSLCASADDKTAYTVADVLNVRSCPDTSAEIVGQLCYGTQVDIVNTEGVWHQINYKDSLAYIHSDYVAFRDASYSPSLLGQKVVEKAMQYIGTPYVYGGMSPSGFDCSGFVKYVYSSLGVNLDRTAAAQACNGYWVSRNELQPGDIICFSSFSGGSYIGHVGIYVGDNKFIHSPRTGYTIRVDNLTGTYAQRYSSARRIF